MFEYTKEIIQSAEEAARFGEVSKSLEVLRALPLDDFCSLFISMPQLDELPNLTALLPRMANAQVQIDWTGSEGVNLLRQTLAFTRGVAQNYAGLTGKPLDGARILDFGCGYGRILRAMYYFSDPDSLFGCDPWEKSLELCREDGMLGNFSLSEYLPTSLPFQGKFDLIYAFSVFTHLSGRATLDCLRVMRGALAENGLIVITIRPVEYWNVDIHVTEDERDRLVSTHRQAGFSFNPHLRDTVDGDVTYGDSSMAVEYIEQIVPTLKVVKVDRTFDDPYQLIVFLRAA